MDTIHINSPVETAIVEKLAVGTGVLISGVIYVARDAAHHRLIQAMDKEDRLPFNLEGQTIYYMGPSPARPGKVIGSAGPTTSSRMDIYTPRLISAGVRAMIGKGSRSTEVKEAMINNRVIYFVTIGGAAALLSRAIKSAEVVAYNELGPEAILRLNVEDFPAIVANDIHGGDLFQQGKAKYRRKC